MFGRKKAKACKGANCEAEKEATSKSSCCKGCQGKKASSTKACK